MPPKKQNYQKQFLIYFILFLAVGNFFLWQKIIQADFSPNLTNLKVAFLDVGQGDGIFIEAPNGNQVLIDGGPNKKILEELSKLMPAYDRQINLLISTHPDADHLAGLIEVLKNFSIDYFLESNITTEKSLKETTKNLIQEKNIKKIISQKDLKIILDSKRKIYLQVLFPISDTTNWATNDASLVIKLFYGDKSFLFTGDSPIGVENYLLKNKSNLLTASVLKLGHHGSKTSNSFPWLQKIKPEYAIISVSKDNRYGHPHQEVLDFLKKLNIPFLTTSDQGNIIFETDGTNLILDK